MLKYNILLILILILHIYSAQPDWLKPVFLNESMLPKSLPAQKGKLVECYKWDDKKGINILVITEYYKGKILERGYASELYAAQYLLNDNNYTTLWKIKDFNYVDSEIRYLKGSLKLDDIDNDSLAENSFLYTIASSDKETIKYILHTKKEKLAIRGYWDNDVDWEKPKLDTIIVDSAFNKFPKIFRSHAVKEWNDIINKKTSNPELPVTKKTDCLSATDTSEILVFKSQIEQYIAKRDTVSILKHVHFPLNVDGEYLNEKQFVKTYYKVFATYLLKTTIDSSEINSLKRAEYFMGIENSPGCYSYCISNAFPELEFNVKFTIEKRGGILKVVSMSIIG